MRELHGRAGTWAALSIRKRLDLLNEIQSILIKDIDHEAWAADSLNAMGYPIDERTAMLQAVEMLMNTRIVSRDIEQLIDTLATVESTGKPPQVSIKALSSGQQYAEVFPLSMADSKGPQKDWKVELWLEPGGNPSQGGFYSPTRHVRTGGVALGKVAVVLGAGNQGFLSMCDVLHMMFLEGAVVILKHNPVRDYGHTWVERLFAPLIREGFLVSFSGSVSQGAFLVTHPLCQHVHITGGTPTHDAIVWGVGEAQQRNKASKVPVLQVPITSELGCITPYMIAPALFTKEELMHHALHLATSFMQNNSCNCNAPKVLVLSEEWTQKAEFIAMLKGILQKRPSPPPYYPGTLKRYKAFQEAYPQAEQVVSQIPSGPPHPKFGAAVPPLFIELPYDEVCSLGAEGHPHALHEEPFAPILTIVTLPAGQPFLEEAPRFCNECVMGSLSATLIAHPSLDSEAVQKAVEELRYGTIAVNHWTGMCFQFEAATWGAFPGETLDAVQSGIGSVRNYLLFDHPQKSVVRSPFTCPSHIGCAAEMMTLQKARYLTNIMLGKIDTTHHNKDNPYRQGNMLPIATEGTHGGDKMILLSGKIPEDLDGMFVRNGTNQRYEPTGKMHMYDGDAMLHCIRIKGGKVLAYSNTWLRTPRFVANEAAGKELYATFGDLCLGGLEVARKMGLQASRMKGGAIPTLADNQRTHPATSTYFVDGKFYACMELSPPFQVHLDPDTGVATSGCFDDLSQHNKGSVDRFSAHYKVDPATGVTHYMSVGFFNPVSTYGTLDYTGKPEKQLKLPFAFPPPAFLHDYFLTKNYLIVVDHSLRINPAGLVPGKLYDFQADKHVRFGLIPRDAKSPGDVQWFDTGMAGTHWHCVNGWETEDSKVVLFMPLFQQYGSCMPVHIATEPSSHLHKFVLDLHSGEVTSERCAALETVVTERCEVNRDFVGRPSQFAYLMRRGEDVMYDGFVKYNLETDTIEAVVDFGKKRLGGEAMFVPRPDGNGAEDDGYLMDLIFDGSTGGLDGIGTSELCIWDAAALTTEPIARVKMPHRIPFGVHAGWLTAEEVESQRKWFEPLTTDLK